MLALRMSRSFLGSPGEAKLSGGLKELLAVILIFWKSLLAIRFWWLSLLYPRSPKGRRSRSWQVEGAFLFQDASKQDGLSAPATTQQLRSFYIGSPIKTKEVEPTLKDTPSSPQGGAMEEDSRQEKRMGSTPGKDRPAKRAAVAASPPFGLKPRANAGQGNCVFEALGQGCQGCNCEPPQAT